MWKTVVLSLRLEKKKKTIAIINNNNLNDYTHL